MKPPGYPTPHTLVEIKGMLHYFLMDCEKSNPPHDIRAQYAMAAPVEFARALLCYIRAGFNNGDGDFSPDMKLLDHIKEAVLIRQNMMSCMDDSVFANTPLFMDRNLFINIPGHNATYLQSELGYWQSLWRFEKRFALIQFIYF